MARFSVFFFSFSFSVVLSFFLLLSVSSPSVGCCKHLCMFFKTSLGGQKELRDVKKKKKRKKRKKEKQQQKVPSLVRFSTVSHLSVVADI